jgi:hypothetical protein
MNLRPNLPTILRVATLLAVFFVRNASSLLAQNDADAVTISADKDSDGDDREAILVKIEARVSFPKSLCADGIGWLQNLSIPPFAPMDPSAAYFNALPSRYSQLSKLNYGTVLLDALATGHFSPTNPGNARRLVFATGSEVLGLRLAKSEKWHGLWWVPQTLSIAINLDDLRSHIDSAEASPSRRNRVPSLQCRSR